MAATIVHDQEKECFKTEVDGLECVLEYRKISATVLDFYHTYVPPKLRGRQIAEQLTTFALEYTRANGFKLVPSCSFVAHFISRNADFKDLVA